MIFKNSLPLFHSRSFLTSHVVVGAGVLVGAVVVVVVGFNNRIDIALPFHVVAVHGVLKKLHHPVL